MKFIVTGTHAYGELSLNSDLDIVMLRGYAELLIGFLKDHNIEVYRTEAQEEYKEHGGFYFDLDRMQINIIIAKDKIDLDRWKYSTKKMREMPPIKNRQKRIDTFNSLYPEDEDDIPF